MKLAPMKKLEERARTKPLTLSEDIPSRQLELVDNVDAEEEEEDEVAISRNQKP